MSRAEFLDELAKRKVPAIQMTVEDLMTELRDLSEAGQDNSP